jgi:hypothetical protein
LILVDGEPIQTENDVLIAQFVAHRIQGTFQNYSCIGVIKEEKLVAGAVYHGYLNSNVNISVAIDDPSCITRKLIWWFLAYPFNQLGCQRVTCIVKKKNTKARDRLLRLGFTLEGNVRKGFESDDMLIYGMLKKEAGKWGIK